MVKKKKQKKKCICDIADIAPNFAIVNTVFSCPIHGDEAIKGAND